MSEEKRKHIVGMLVKDEPGVLAKISGLFTRRGFNIDTIVVGKTNLKGISHIVISLQGDERTIEQLDKQVAKLEDVVKLADFKEEESIVREHCLLKINSAESIQKLEKACKKHNASILHTNHKFAIVELVEEPEKIDAFVQEMAAFGIKELSRSGINALKKE
ncbi:MAG: acetolactate synthase small subunit [Candidatus Diapherotrites archaeon]|uniref:Acetolactate synthase small subunit n=1 Tax=Candidatus Iainarchaeum sp. TaxID=3101447 RepID=A0A7J4JUC0_9ARCH|nr:acetolactate synthase small subunit [Candidatus Diapherotrites archaeon]HIH21382.1 acetolactate synthase small subunit [Candidatus Diapherotrites archaeon]HIH33292.1 acetolactate synthase small subunit [Candidatus Diapherotrites archaeon]